MSKELPILFSTPMVQAILEGRKTQTRRLNNLNEINKSPNDWSFAGIDGKNFGTFWSKTQRGLLAKPQCPYGKVGDRLWVRESAYISDYFLMAWDTIIIIQQKGVLERKDYDNKPRLVLPVTEISSDIRNRLKGYAKITPSIYMPRWASRISLEITNIRVERLQDISEEDAKAEGVEIPKFPSVFEPYKDAFRELWQKINGKDSWMRNDWVWMIEFKRID